MPKFKRTVFDHRKRFKQEDLFLQNRQPHPFNFILSDAVMDKVEWPKKDTLQIDLFKEVESVKNN
jgi:hypothetical protein